MHRGHGSFNDLQILAFLINFHFTVGVLFDSFRCQKYFERDVWFLYLYLFILNEVWCWLNLFLNSWLVQPIYIFMLSGLSIEEILHWYTNDSVWQFWGFLQLHSFCLFPSVFILIFPLSKLFWFWYKCLFKILALWFLMIFSKFFCTAIT